MSETAGVPSAQVVAAHDLRGLLRVTPFRRLWVALGLSSLGDWLGFLAVTALAASYGTNYMLANFAVGGVLILRMLPSLLFGPLAGAWADRFDRRVTMVVSDLVRFGMYASIPLVNTWWWLFIATLVTEIASIFWTPAKEATVPNILPRKRLEAANQLGLVTTYGTAPIAAGVFTVLATASSLLGRTWLDFLAQNPQHPALYLNAATFLFAAFTVFRLKAIPAPDRSGDGSERRSVFRQIGEGWAFVGRTRMVRGLVFGMLGAFAAGGAVIAVGRVFVASMHAGDAGYGILFGAVFVGMAAGMFAGPRLLRGFSRRRMFGLCLIWAGVLLVGIGLIENLVIVLILTLAVGGCAGLAWVIGYTLIGLEVDDAVRGRTFAFLQMMVRIVLIGVLAVAPLIAGAIGAHEIRPFDFLLHFDGSHAVILMAAVLMLVMGTVAFRQMDDRPGVPVLRDLYAAVRGKLAVPEAQPSAGVFVAFEGGDGAGKSTQVQLLTSWLTEAGYQVVTTREPGSTAVGAKLRALLLDPATGDLDARTEAMLYAADRAQHVAEVIKPALGRGAVVVTDRYADSSRAYQGAGRELAEEDIGRLSTWATDGLVPDLTVVLDLPPEAAARRRTGAADRLERESLEFHERVRRGFLDLAGRDPDRYLVVDATQPPEQVAGRVRERLEPLLATGRASGQDRSPARGRP